MNVGKGFIISDEWIPKDIDTGLNDINGNRLRTSNKVSLTGCVASFAYVGQSDGGFVLFFGGNCGTVCWHLDENIIMEHSVQVITVKEGGSSYEV